MMWKIHEDNCEDTQRAGTFCSYDNENKTKLQGPYGAIRDVSHVGKVCSWDPPCDKNTKSLEALMWKCGLCLYQVDLI